MEHRIFMQHNYKHIKGTFEKVNNSFLNDFI